MSSVILPVCETEKGNFACISLDPDEITSIERYEHMSVLRLADRSMLYCEYTMPMATNIINSRKSPPLSARPTVFHRVVKFIARLCAPTVDPVLTPAPPPRQKTPDELTLRVLLTKSLYRQEEYDTHELAKRFQKFSEERGHEVSYEGAVVVADFLIEEHNEWFAENRERVAPYWTEIDRRIAELDGLNSTVPPERVLLTIEKILAGAKRSKTKII